VSPYSSFAADRKYWKYFAPNVIDIDLWSTPGARHKTIKRNKINTNYIILRVYLQCIIIRTLSSLMQGERWQCRVGVRWAVEGRGGKKISYRAHTAGDCLPCVFASLVLGGVHCRRFSRNRRAATTTEVSSSRTVIPVARARHQRRRRRRLLIH